MQALMKRSSIGVEKQKTIKSLTGNTIKYMIRQLDCLGLLPNYVRSVANLVVQTYKGHVTIVPSPGFRDYANLLKNVKPEDFPGYMQEQYV